MRKYVIGFVCGACVSMSTMVYASDAIQAFLFPVKISFNDKKMDMSETDGVCSRGSACQYLPSYR
ncbi:hypothetical protein Elgi_50280 [Paenibacillus elgii]|nr:hypothetical protein Elgi_50280 [Paenibacillus elgii]